MWKIFLFLLSTSASPASAHLFTDSLDLTLVGEDQKSQDRNSNVVPSVNLSRNFGHCLPSPISSFPGHKKEGRFLVRMKVKEWATLSDLVEGSP